MIKKEKKQPILSRGKYAYALMFWKENWDNLTSYFNYPIEIRKIIYTTNVIESLNNCIGKYTKSKSVFPDDQAVLKSVYFAIMNVERKWCLSIRNRGLILSQFLILFDERYTLDFRMQLSKTQNLLQTQLI
jgi:putative transposase